MTFYRCPEYGGVFVRPICAHIREAMEAGSPPFPLQVLPQFYSPRCCRECAQEYAALSGEANADFVDRFWATCPMCLEKWAAGG